MTNKKIAPKNNRVNTISAYAELLTAKTKLEEIRDRNKTLGIGNLFQIELQRLNKYISEIEQELDSDE
jgi:hypothetical protein